ncbi:hypothetical protein H9P43_000842 [Blastocladiella emersonii ATCC 22665]|nr:hypothetical protein H9P43_000842 [Blastocladiella emersonii ATCC 22665]
MKEVPLIFAPMRPVAEGSAVDEPGKTLIDNDALDGVGQIRVEVWTGYLEPRRNTVVTNAHRQVVLTEKQKKAALVTHTAGYGNPTRKHTLPQNVMQKTKLVHVFIFNYLSRDMLEVRKYIDTPDVTATALTGSPSTARVKPERGTTQFIDLTSLGGGDSSAHKRHRPNEGPARPTPVVYLDDSDDEETSRAPRKLPVKAEPSSSSGNPMPAVISLLSDDDE